MGKQPLNIDAILATVSRPGDRSPLFCWLYEHHDELAEALQGRRILWRAFCALFIEVGLKDANGNTPTERTARETWYQVRREVSRQRAVRVTIQAMRSGPPMPSKAPPTWQPPIASAGGPGAAKLDLPQSARAEDAVPQPAPAAELTASEKVARLRQKLRDRTY